MRVYTRTGDDGTTGLVGNERVLKTDLRIEALGAVDELNAHLAELPSSHLTQRAQNLLFDIGACLASPSTSQLNLSVEIKRLETDMDQMQETLPPLRNFILPGGSPSAGKAHIARAVARRAERDILRMKSQYDVPDEIVVYINRLSDWLFVLARSLNHSQNVADVIWQKLEGTE